MNIADLAIRTFKLQNISNIPVNCCIECGLFPRSLMESTIAGAGFAGERRTLGSNDDYRLKTSQKKQVISQSFDETPSSIYSWSISHILEHEFFCLGRLGSFSKKKKI